MKKLPTREEAKKFLESAKAQKLEVPEAARKVMTDTIATLCSLGLLSKEELDEYHNVTKSNVRR